MQEVIEPYIELRTDRNRSGLPKSLYNAVIFTLEYIYMFADFLVYDPSDFSSFLKDTMKDEYTEWKKKQRAKAEEQKSVEQKSVEPFDIDKAYELALAKVQDVVNRSYNRLKLTVKPVKLYGVELQTFEFQQSWFKIISPTISTVLGTQGTAGITNLTITGSNHKKASNFVDSVSYLSLFSWLEIVVRITDKTPGWIKKFVKPVDN